ncbi:MAG: elongation factor P maturation arginine rhamnosyltransferase EarP [Treponema sp.]|nr:elongation factor P maturation arginine rhamnosyltransferase EarP [Treponema sp.]
MPFGTPFFINMEITVLCKVVDNFGDIGLVYRMCRNFLEIKSNLSVNLIVDDLKSFANICDYVKVQEDFQLVEEINVYNWNAAEKCYSDFSKNDGEKLSIILECFQCGRPDWMEKILFEDKLNRTVHILMIDYLTAEKYAEDFHCLQSLTRSAKVQKINFMPGFTEKTGGLIIDSSWKELPLRKKDGNILVFTYELNLDGLAAALKNYCDESGKKVLLAEGRGKNPFIQACKKLFSNEENEAENKKEDFTSSLLEELPYMNQSLWDKMMKDSSILVIRGEESMSRACLSGIPFIWNAYPQSEEYQLVKVKALLERMKEYFAEEDFVIVERVWLAFNSCDSSYEELYNSFYDFFHFSDRFEYAFSDFALALRKNGDLCCKIMTFIEKNYIIDK